MLPEEEELCSSPSNVLCSVSCRQGVLTKREKSLHFSKGRWKTVICCQIKSWWAKLIWSWKPCLYLFRVMKVKETNSLIICSQCRISGALEAPWITLHNCRAGLTLVCCKSGVPALTHFSPWKAEGLGFTHSFLGKQQIHEIKTLRKGEVRVKQSKPTVVCPGLGLDVTSVCRRLFVSGPVVIYLFMYLCILFWMSSKESLKKKKGLFY